VSTRRRHVAIAFRFKPAPQAVLCAGCAGLVLAGTHAWFWLEHGQQRCGCRRCLFRHATARAAA